MKRKFIINLHGMMEADREGKLDQYLEENKEALENSRKLAERYQQSVESAGHRKRREISIKDVERHEFHNNF